MIENTPPYCTDHRESMKLVERIKSYYAKRGHDVRVWLEKRVQYGPDGDIAVVFYDIRSDLKFKIN